MKKITQEKFHKYIKKIIKNNEENMTLFCHEKESNSFIIEGKRVKFQGIFFAYSRGDFQICFGQIGKEHFFYSNDESCKDHLYIIIDQRDQENRFHINYSDQFVTHSEQDSYEEREIVLTYVENQNFAQFQVYDSILKQNKFGEYFADTESTIASSRCIALDQLVNVIPNITEVIPDFYECKVEE